MNSFKGTVFSNMYVLQVPIEYQEILYYSNENFFQAMKTTDIEVRKHIASVNPYESKRIGKTIDLRPDWLEIRMKVMEVGLERKFRDPVLAKALLATGNAELVEANTWGDTYWGVCKGVGQNHLGRLLMQLRTELNNGVML